MHACTQTMYKLVRAHTTSKHLMLCMVHLLFHFNELEICELETTYFSEFYVLIVVKFSTFFHSKFAVNTFNTFSTLFLLQF